MDALIASAGPLKKRKRGPPSSHGERDQSHRTVDRGPSKEAIDPSTLSILSSTRMPSAFHARNLASGSSFSPLRPDPKISRIADKKLRAKVAREDIARQRAALERADVDEWLNAPQSGQGGIEVDAEADERTWRIGQAEIVREVGVASGSKKFDLKFDNMGSYAVDYTRNGRFMAIASSKGHVATFDWQAGKLGAEVQLKDHVRDIKFLQSESFFAVAQRKCVFIYDQDGVELHKLKQHIDPIHMEFLPYHYLLSTVGNAGHLKYHDVSTGVLLTQIATHLGAPASMAQNPHSAIIHLGHANGTMTLWSPNMSTPHVKLLAHLGPVRGIAIDPSEGSAGRYCATAGLDGVVKLWDARNWGKEVTSFSVRNAPTTLDYSSRGMLAVGGKAGVGVYRDLARGGVGAGQSSKTPYLTLPLPGLAARAARFCPFDDVLAVGHERGVSSLLVPGAGEANFDSAEADVFESHTRRRERDVRAVLDKIRPELITLDTDFLGHVDPAKAKGGGTHAEREARSFRQLGRLERLRASGKADEDEDVAGGVEDDEADANVGEVPTKKEKTKHKMRGKGTGMKRYLAKKKKNVIDPALIAVRDKVEAQNRADELAAKVARGEVVKEKGALARFG
ncbi:putative U3 small nucleolar RNA-associated protein 7 [Cryptotrichosporon argae]